MADDAADRLVARAIESVLDQVPGSVDTSLPEGASTKLQPWAETAAPVGRNKRPLEDLLAEIAEQVAAAPDARASVPRTRHPALAFFDRFGRGAAAPGRADGDRAGSESGSGSRRRRRRRGGGGGRAAEAVGQPAGPTDVAPGGRRRSRRGRGGGGQGPTAAGPAAARPDGSSSGPAARQPGGGGRRRRGRRGRGGGGDRPPG